MRSHTLSVTQIGKTNCRRSAFFRWPGENLQRANTVETKAKLEVLAAERNTLMAEMKDITENIKAAGGEATEEQETAFAGKRDRLEAVKAEESEISAKAERIQGFLTEFEELEKQAKNMADQPNARGVNVSSAPAGDDKKITIPAQARKFSGRLKAFSGEAGGRSAEERAYRFGQFALAKLRNDLPQYFAGRFNDSVTFARDHWNVNLGGVQNASHGEGAGDTTGAHVFVPDEFGMDLIKLREQYGIARNVLRTVPMVSDTKTQPKRTGGLTAYAVGENSAGTESQASYEDVRLTARKWMCIARMSSELGEDAAINFGDELADEISYAFANKEDECAFNGDGTSTYHGILGIRNRLDTLTAGTAPGLALGAGNAWSELTLANHEAVVGGLPLYADGPQAVWVCHKTYYYTVMVRLLLASGGTTAEEIVNGRRTPIFLGYPVVFSQVFPSSEANSQIPVIFGNMALGAMFGDRRAETIQFTDTASVGGESLWERDQIGVRGTERFDVAVHGYGSNTVAGPICGLETAAS